MQTEIILGVDDLPALFNVFHDGVIVDASSVDEDLLLTVRISYLAERIAPGFTMFTVRLHKVEEVSFSSWPKDSAAPPETLRSLSAIFYPHLDILSGEPSSGYVRVVCNQSSSETPHCGGTLTFRATSAVVCDQNRKSYSLADLSTLADTYWKDWSERNSTP
jgi:hypothetical protein